jgi:hypothetical protein
MYISQMDAKEQLFINAVKQASEDIGLEREPSVIFCDGYIPGQGPDVRACIEVHSRVIYVSRLHLEEMDYGEIRHVAIHEISHIFEQSHDGRFHRICQDIRVSTWRPEFTTGIRFMVGNSRHHLEDEEIKEKAPVIDKTRCNYHLCRREAKLTQCPYCHDYFCQEHINPRPPSFPNFDYPNKFNEWKDDENTHPCTDYYDHLVREDRGRHRKYQYALDTMNLISKPKDYPRSNKIIDDKTKINPKRNRQKDNKTIECENCGKKVPSMDIHNVYLSKVKRYVHLCPTCQNYALNDIDEIKIQKKEYEKKVSSSTEVVESNKNNIGNKKSSFEISKSIDDKISEKNKRKKDISMESPTYRCNQCGKIIRSSEAKIEYINGDNIPFCFDCYEEEPKPSQTINLSTDNKDKVDSKKKRMRVILGILVVVAIISIILAVNSMM